MKNTFLMLLLALPATSYSADATQYLADTSALQSALAGADFIEVEDELFLFDYLQAEIEHSCPAVVLVIYNENGYEEGASSYSVPAFLKALKREGSLAKGKAYLIFTRYNIYFFNNTKYKVL